MHLGGWGGGAEGELIIEEGNRAPAVKATHSHCVFKRTVQGWMSVSGQHHARGWTMLITVNEHQYPLPILVEIHSKLLHMKGVVASCKCSVAGAAPAKQIKSCAVLEVFCTLKK